MVIFFLPQAWIVHIWLLQMIWLCMTGFWIQGRHFMLLLIRSGLLHMMRLVRAEFVLAMIMHVRSLELVMCS